MLESIINNIQYFFHLERGRWYMRNYIRCISFLTDDYRISAIEAERKCPSLIRYKTEAKKSVETARKLKIQTIRAGHLD